MTLTPGQRLTRADRAAYVVGELAWSADRATFFQARKVFWNYRDQDRSLYETNPDEWLRVLVRVAHGDEKEAIRAALDFELAQVLGRLDLPNQPEPIDRLDGPDGLPLIVLSDPVGEPLRDGPPPPGSLPGRIRLLHEVLILLDALHRANLATGPIDAADFVVTPFGGWTFFGSHRLRPAQANEHRADLVAWGHLAARLLLGRNLEMQDPRAARHQLAPLRETVPETARPRFDALLTAIERALDPDDAATTAADLLRDRSPARGPVAALQSAWRGLFGRGRGD